MNILEIKQIKYVIGVREILNLKNLSISEGQKIGLIGKNGVGKSSLLSILSNKVRAEVGVFEFYGSYALLPQLHEATSTMSGGEITQKYLVELFLTSPKLLMLDEPTNNLDYKHIQWLEKELHRFKGSMIIVSHNRDLLDSICDTIWELDHGNITPYTGNYSDYLEQKQLEYDTKMRNYERYKSEKKSLENAISLKRNQALKAGKAPKGKSFSEINAKGAKPHYGKVQKGLYNSMNSLETRLEKLTVMEKPEEDAKIIIEVPLVKKFKNKMIIRVDRLTGKVNEELLWEPVSFNIKLGDKIGLVGSNGTGKTTLIKKLLSDSDSAIYISPYAKIGYFDQMLDILVKDKSVIENVMYDAIQPEPVVRAVLNRLGFKNDEVLKQVDILSGGERVKILLAKLLVGDYNTLFLDEPSNHLDIQAIEALENLLQNYSGTIILITHDKYLLEKVALQIWHIENKKINIYQQETGLAPHAQSHKIKKDEKLLIDMKITKILSQLSLNPTPELELEYESLLKIKRDYSQDDIN